MVSESICIATLDGPDCESRGEKKVQCIDKGRSTSLILMSKATTGIVAAVGCVTIASLVLNILIWVKVKDDYSDTKTDSESNVKFEQIPIKIDPIPTAVRHTAQKSRPSKTRLRTISSVAKDKPFGSIPEPMYVNNTKFCPSYGEPDRNNPKYEEAATFILSGLDQLVDPCDDFYKFACNTYIKNHNASEMGVERIGTYDEAQDAVNVEITEALLPVSVDDTSRSETERIVKAALLACVHHSRARDPIDNIRDVLLEMKELFGGIPFLNHSLKPDLDLFNVMGQLEQNHAMGSLMASMVSVDYKNVERNALYISQPSLPMARDYYVLPQHTNMVEDRVKTVNKMLKAFAEKALADASPYFDMIKAAARDVVKLEVQIAMASWPNTAMRNYAQQYNPYTMEELEKRYPTINWDSYLKALLSSVTGYDINSTNIVIAQPSYVAWLDALFGGETNKETIVNYLLTNLIFEDADFIGGIINTHMRNSEYVKYAVRSGKGITRIGAQTLPRLRGSADDPNIECLNKMMIYMPFGPGYVYVKSKEDREAVLKDVEHQTDLIFRSFLKMIESLKWMSQKSKDLAKEKATEMIRNYGWPKDLFGDFENSTKIDQYHKLYTSQSVSLVRAGKNDRWIAPIGSLEDNKVDYSRITEEHGRTTNGYSRNIFLLSPALVNAWYQPERNSITFPYADFNPPYYSYGYPQAFNYGGQAGTGGHELVHGFDDQGLQFGPDGSLSNCTWIECGWMDPKTKESFRDMAQCVVTQYSTQCCPQKSGNVKCANGVNTQGENIADIGGELAAYFAYQEYVKELKNEEKRLPGLEQYTPNQLFWMGYGFSWCMSITPSRLTKQLLTNVHSPAVCRVNNVLQNIPEFAKDFGCSIGQNMYPPPDQRCAVWIDE